MKLCRLLVVSLFIASSAFAIAPKDAKYGGHCAYGLSMGKQVMTDCSITYTDPATNANYCFLNEQNKSEFMKNSSMNIVKADGEFIKIGALNQANAAMNDASKAMADAQKQMNNSMNTANSQMNAQKNAMGTAPAGH